MDGKSLRKLSLHTDTPLTVDLWSPPCIYLIITIYIGLFVLSILLFKYILDYIFCFNFIFDLQSTFDSEFYMLYYQLLLFNQPSHIFMDLFYIIHVLYCDSWNVK